MILTLISCKVVLSGCDSQTHSFGRKKNHLMDAMTEIKYALEHSSFIWRAAVVFLVINLQPA